jgi:hypothetical protein
MLRALDHVLDTVDRTSVVAGQLVGLYAAGIGVLGPRAIAPGVTALTWEGSPEAMHTTSQACGQGGKR